MPSKLFVIPPYTLSFYEFLREGKGFAKHVQDKKFSLSYAKSEEFISLSRLIHDWIENGLIDETVRDNKGAWKRFSLQDLVWIRILIKLRKWFDFPVSKIEVVKQYLFTNRHFNHGEKLFPYCLALVLQKAPLQLIILPDGEAHILSELQIEAEKEKLTDYISISLNEIVKGIMSDPNLEPEYATLLNLSDKEITVLSLIRSGQYRSVEVILKNGEVERYTATQGVDLDTRLGDLLNDNTTPFSEIQILRNDNQIVSIKRTIKGKVE